MMGVQYTRTAADALVERDPVILYAAVLLVGTTGGDVALYNGHDATNGVLVATLKGTANVSNPVQFGPGVLLRNGLYIDVGSNVTEICVVWERAL